MQASTKYKFIFIFSLILYVFNLHSQTVTNGSVTGGPVGNSQIQNAAPWLDCGGSADLCDISFPSYSGNSTVAASPSPDGGTWAGIASISAGECASTTITGLTVGQSYTLYFCAANFGSGSTIFNGSPATPRVCVGTTCQTYSIPLLASTWNSYSLNFTATAATLTLELFYASSNNFAYASFDGFNLNAPCGNTIPITTQDTTICQGASVHLIASGGSGSFSWYPLGNSGNILSTNNSVIVTPDSTSSYVVTDGISNDTATVTVTPIFANAGNDTTICSGSTVILGGAPSGLPSSNFSWSPSSGLSSTSVANPSTAPISTQEYVLQVSDAGCNAVDSVLISIQTDTTSFDTLNICPGGGVFIHGNFETVTGNYTQNYTSSLGCDSLSNVYLSILPRVDSTINVNICNGQSYFAQGANQTSSGTYIDTFIASNNCDSIITTILNILPSQFSSDSVFICQGDSFFAGGAFQDVSGNYIDTFIASNSCDSIHTTILSVINNIQSFDTLQTCQGEQIIIHGSPQNTQGVYLDTLTSSIGCDSISSIYLMVSNIVYETVDVEICSGENYFAGGAVQSESGIYLDTLISSRSCDSILTTNLSILRSDTIDNTLSICDGESIDIQGNEQDSAGVYTTTFLNSVGCDSVVNIELSINPIFLNTFDYNICKEDSVLINGIYYNRAQTITDTLSSIEGCDSIVQHTIEVKPKPEFDLGEDINLCEGETQIIGLDSIPLGYQIIWGDGSKSLTKDIQQSGVYTLGITDSNCYTLYDSISVQFGDCSFYIYMPNAFSPNGDGSNDIYIPVYNGEIEDYILRVFDRWGELLFETRDINIGWNGKHKGNALNPGVYVWTIGYNTPKNVREVKSGSLTLIQ